MANFRKFNEINRIFFLVQGERYSQVGTKRRHQQQNDNLCSYSSSNHFILERVSVHKICRIVNI